MNGSENNKPMNWVRKSEIAERADRMEARAQAKREIEAQAGRVRFVVEYGVIENGKTRPATPTEIDEFERWTN